MIQVDISLKNPFSEKHNKHLGTMLISSTLNNEDKSRGDYDGELISAKNGNSFRSGVVENYPRKSYNVWRLVFRMLWDILPEEQKRVENEIRKKVEKEIKEKHQG